MGNYHLRRSKHENNFTQISNEIFNLKVINKKNNTYKWVSPQLLGIFSKLMTLKPGTNVSAKMLADGFGIHIDTIRGYLADLEKLGYLKTQMKQPVEGGYFTKHYFLQECITEKFLNDFYEPETEEQYTEDSEVMIPTFDNNFYVKRKLDGPENSVQDFQVGVENPSREIGLNELEEKIGTGNPEPCITCNNNINNNIIKNNIKKINALSSKEESACAVQGQSLNSNVTSSSLALENNKLNNMINGTSVQIGSKSKKIKNKAQLHEIEKEMNGGDVSVSEMIISKVSDLSYTDNQLANMQRQMNVISAEQKENKIKQNKRERQFTLVKEYIDKNVMDPDLNDKWKQYALTLKEKGSLASKTQFIEIYSNAQTITTDKTKMLEYLSNSISHGWVGIYQTETKNNKPQEKEVVKQYTVPTPMKDRKIARDENGNPLLF